MKELISPAEADALLASIPRYSPVTLPLARCQGRVLREEIRADRAQPPFDRVAMDGIAFAHAAWERGLRRFAVEGMQKAGDKPRKLKSEAGCLEVMTGTVLPAGADCIAPAEDIRIEDGHAVLLERYGEAVRYRFVHRAGADCAQGDLVAAEGTLLEAPHLGAAAACGMKDLRVADAPMVAVVATGDELVDPGRMPLPHQIRRSNPSAIEAALHKRHIDRLAVLHCRDDAARLRAAIEGVLGKCHALILTGGVSMGRTDYVPAVLKDLGVRPLFHKILQKPGKPFWFGLAAGGRPVFGLPGNPASVLVCLHRYVLPALLRAQGAAGESHMPALLAEGMGAPGKLTQFRPATFAWDGDGRLRAAWAANQGSGDFTGWARAHGFVEVPAGDAPVEAGSVLKAWRW
jgi:molybdopterin molybdotransferase